MEKGLLLSRFLSLCLVCATVRSVRAMEVCCEGIGCFSDAPPYNGLPLPVCGDKLNMNLQVYTRRNTATGQPITKNTIPAVFNGQLLSIYIVHAYQETPDEQWIHIMKDTLLAQGDYNVIIVGWTGGSLTLNYYQGVSNTRTAGAEIAQVASNTVNNGGSTQSRTHCIGYSLGAHVCGHAGEKLTFGRITGLDPAGPDYDNRDVTAGLNPSNAYFVDVIHTDGKPDIQLLQLGSLRRRGHVDFYPNGGGRQPQCTALITPIIRMLIPTLTDFLSMNISSIRSDVAEVVACNHHQSVAYFMESIRTPCFLSRYYDCADVNNLPFTCTWSFNPVQSLGLNANTYAKRGVFYLTTNFVSPYCLN